MAEFALTAPVRAAELSECGRYRWTLSRAWGSMGTVAFIGLNPSTADAELDDPTIRRCMGFAREFGAGRLVMLNLFAWRATDPNALFAAEDPVGVGNDEVLLREARRADLVIAAWGAHPATRMGCRAGQVRAALERDGVQLHVLRLTKAGAPAHPLYLPALLRPVTWGTDAADA